MDYKDRINEVITANAICVNNSEIEKVLQQVHDALRSFPRIPNVIDKTKKYKTFTIQDRGEAGDVYILLRDTAEDIPSDHSIFSLRLELNIDYFTYSEILRKLIPEKHVINSFETIGDIIHLNLSDEQLRFKEIIGSVLNYKTGMTVINKTGQIDNTFRFYKSEVLAGKNSLQTVHKENDVRIWLDLGNVYWCSRLQTERRYITEMIQRGESLCDPFCGAGPQVLPALKKGATVYANDLNPCAISCLERSLVLNRLACDCVQNMDAKLFIRSLIGKKIDHFVFNLPEFSIDFIGELEPFSNFRLHCFLFCRVDEDPVQMIKQRTGYAVKQEWLRKIRMVSPSKAVFKLEVQSQDFYDVQEQPSRANF